MVKKLNYIVLFFLSSAFLTKDNNHRYIPNESFSEGEEITYRAHYGFVNAAEGRMVISDKLYRVNDRVCYKIDVFGESTGMFDFFLRIRDTWGSYVDTAAILPHKFYRILEEGKYRKHEIVDFNHTTKKASVKTYNFREKFWKKPLNYDVSLNTQDLVSGYYFLRTIDFSEFQEGDELKMDAFFEDKEYDFTIRYLGKEQIKTKIGKINAIVLSPKMPENKLFDGENSIKVWISDDKRKIPLKIRAAMFVGAVEIEIKSYKKGKRN